MTDIPGNSRLTFTRTLPTAPQHVIDAGDADTGLDAVLATLWRGKWIILCTTIMAVLLGAHYAFVRATPLYTSTAVVMLDTQQDQVAGLESIVSGLTGDTSEINSEVQVFRSRVLLGRVVDRLDLTSDPEFNSALRGSGGLGSSQTGLDRFMSGMLGQATSPVSIATDHTRDLVITALLGKLSVRNVRQSYVFEVTAETTDPVKSKRIADAVVQQYIQDQIDVKLDATVQATSWLSDRVAELQIELEQAEEAVKTFSASTELVSADGLTALERQIKDLRDRIENARDKQAGLEAKRIVLTESDTRAEQAGVTQDRRLNALLPRVDRDATARREFDARVRVLLAETRTDLAKTDQQLTTLQTAEAGLARRVEQQGQDLIRLQQLTREAEATRLLYEHFLTRLKETAAQQGVHQPDSRILSEAVIAGAPASPRTSLIVGMSVILGLVIGAALVLTRELRNTCIRSAAELERLTGYTVMGQVPVLPVTARGDVLGYLKDTPLSPVAEAVRNLRTSLLLSSTDTPPQVIVLTSSVPGEGKTTSAIALAQNLAGLGKSVLLLDGDTRSQSLSQQFGEAPGQGLLPLFRGDTELGDAVSHAAGFDGDILTSGTSGVVAADLFASDRFADILQGLREVYDVILIDTPSALTTPDARILSQYADAILFTVRWNSTPLSHVEEALRLFHTSNLRLDGMILSQMNARDFGPTG